MGARGVLHLSAVKLAELHSDLKIQEKDELSWKKLKAEGLDEDGEKEAKLRRNLHVIMAKYGMNGKKEAAAQATNFIKDGLENDSLEDPRLEKLWNKARSSGRFQEEELDKLWREFAHHREKVREYNILLETVRRAEDTHKNMINPLEEEQLRKEERLLGQHSELKERLHSINQGFERLRRVSHQGYDATSEFEEPRVIDLWDMAKSTNFTEKELESLRVSVLRPGCFPASGSASAPSVFSVAPHAPLGSPSRLPRGRMCSLGSAGGGRAPGRPLG
ncbi:Alpha-2-macroglobulin receptor-associated protein [Varanus komodoensis]|nr:Alpha-2-macroglobulin receptor-associated protein [Varanus komodoensis]